MDIPRVSTPPTDCDRPLRVVEWTWSIGGPMLPSECHYGRNPPIPLVDFDKMWKENRSSLTGLSVNENQSLFFNWNRDRLD